MWIWRPNIIITWVLLTLSTFLNVFDSLSPTLDACQWASGVQLLLPPLPCWQAAPPHPHRAYRHWWLLCLPAFTVLRIQAWFHACSASYLLSHLLSSLHFEKNFSRMLFIKPIDAKNNKWTSFHWSAQVVLSELKKSLRSLKKIHPGR